MITRLLRAVGWLLCAAAVALVVLVVGRDVAADHQTAEAQSVLRTQLPEHAVAATGGQVPVARRVPPGDALAELRIPRFGTSWSWIVVEGTTESDLASGPGHYPGTPLPGDRGNVAIAAHRAGHGDPFLDFDELRPGDLIRLRQGDVEWRYRISSTPEIVAADALWVLEPLPGRQLTLTTCWPKYGSSRRMFVRARLVD